MKQQPTAGSYTKQEIDQRRDALLLSLLKTPPQPRPKRERLKPKPHKPRTTGGKSLTKKR